MSKIVLIVLGVGLLALPIANTLSLITSDDQLTDLENRCIAFIQSNNLITHAQGLKYDVEKLAGGNYICTFPLKHRLYDGVVHMKVNKEL